ncbi:MAG: phytanoyl-CoA dioxygenase family protein [Alphaproteobacteria bacterium]|nr:phytanoyl-CoA dioxygenase family protein [Alphaproteobacteria bacterium]
MRGCVVKGKPVPESLIAELPDSAGLLDRPAELRKRLADDGFVFLRGVIDPAIVMAGRTEVLARLEAVGEIAPGTGGIFTGHSTRRAREADLGRFWQSVSEGPRLRAASHGRGIERVMTAIAGEAVRAQDYMFLRVGVPGRATGIHYDYPFFTRAHDQVWTVWMPIGDVPVMRGPVVVVENSHRFRDLVDQLIGFDVVRNPERKAAFTQDAIEIVRGRGTRLLTADFKTGDVLVFGMFLAHGSLDHHDATGMVRVSCDVRWQPARLPIDERYFGANPGGTTGAGYGELNGAKPLDVDWHVR